MIRIPRQFHSIWLGNSPIPEEFERYIASWTECNPGWTHRIWRDADVDDLRLQNADLFEISDISLACKSDILRLEILYDYGGVYVDVDFECFRCIEPAIDDSQQFIGRQMEGEFCNAILGCTKCNTYFKRLMDALPESFEQYNDAISRVGPRFFDRMLVDMPFTILPKEQFYPYLWSEEFLGVAAYPYAYAAHHWAGSWNK